MNQRQAITGIQEIRDAIRAEQRRARRFGDQVALGPLASVSGASHSRRIISAVRALPLLGRPARWAYGLYMAPRRIRDLLVLIRMREDEANGARMEREKLGASLQADMVSYHRLLQAEIQKLRLTSDEVEAGLAGLGQSLSDQGAGIHDLQERLKAVAMRAADLGRNLASAENRLGALQAEVSGMGEPLAVVRAEQDEERRREEAVAAVYPRLESHFRGSRDLIKERQSIYLPYLLATEAAKNGLPVLDLGCGRGEWLELLAGNGFVARGVEQNQEFAGECRRRGLVVEEAEAGLFLAGLKSESVGGVTAFHLLEHLSFAAWLGILQETVRVLAPGGVAIFETPNPENLLVSSSDFFLDPTHQRPIPSRLLCYVAKTVGLVRGRVLELHPRRDEAQKPDGAVEPLLDRHLLGPQDYALLAWKD